MNVAIRQAPYQVPYYPLTDMAIRPSHALVAQIFNSLFAPSGSNLTFGALVSQRR